MPFKKRTAVITLGKESAAGGRKLVVNDGALGYDLDRAVKIIQAAL